MIGQTSDFAPVLAMAILAAVFAVKHFAADFVLQTNWIALGKDCRSGWLGPLAAHAAIHAALALVIVLAVAPRLWWLAVVDFVVHFGIDRGKSILGHWAELEARNPKYWWLLGLDQLLHQLTNIALALALLVL
jgi:hypothetical protein